MNAKTVEFGTGLLAMLLAATATPIVPANDRPDVNVDDRFNPMAQRGEIRPHRQDSGVLENATDEKQIVYSEVVHTEGAVWTRLYFEDVNLPQGGTIRVTSLLDGEVQELDQAGLEMWSMSTAYFNGDAVLLELLASPNTQNNRVVIAEVGVDFADGQAIGLCGICGSDDRVPSNEQWSGRTMPNICSTAIYNTESCMVSAGHCFPLGFNPVVQFNVPNSTAGCFLQNPPVSDQFPITDWVTQSGSSGVGNDWAIVQTGTNNIGQTAYQRYGEFRPIADSQPFSGPVDVWGYGSSETCTLTNTQQRSTGNIINVFGTHFTHNADTTAGNSGAAVLQNDQIIGIVTHCPCPNVAQRIDTNALQVAMADFCPAVEPPSNNCCESGVAISEGSTEFSNVGANTCGFDEGGSCDLFGDTNVQSDIWFRHTTQCTGQLTISACDSDFFVKIAVYEGGCPNGPGEAIACDVNSCSEGNAGTVTIDVEQGELYRIRIGGHLGATGQGTIEISCDDVVEPECPGDLTGSGDINVDDLLIVLNNWGSCLGGEPGCDGDANEDGEVNVDDLLIILNNWGPCD